MGASGLPGTSARPRRDAGPPRAAPVLGGSGRPCSRANEDSPRGTPRVSDSEGNEYDLSALSKVRKPWIAVDTSAEGSKRTFYLSVCTPLPYVPGCRGECSVRRPFRPPSLPTWPLTDSPALCRQCSGVLPGVRRAQLEPGRCADQSSSRSERVAEHRLRQRGQVREPALFHQDNARVRADLGACAASTGVARGPFRSLCPANL